MVRRSAGLGFLRSLVTQGMPARFAILALKQFGKGYGESEMRADAAAFERETENRELMGAVFPDELIPDEVITELKFPRPRSYWYQGVMTYTDPLTGEVEEKWASMMSNERFSPESAQAQFIENYGPSYEEGDIEVIGFQVETVFHNPALPY